MMSKLMRATSRAIALSKPFTNSPSRCFLSTASKRAFLSQNAVGTSQNLAAQYVLRACKLSTNAPALTASLPTADARVAAENEYAESDCITVIGQDCPKPFLHFADFQWPVEVNKVIKKHSFQNPTPIQAQGFPVALEGRDLVGIAQTGSGKTLSFIMPAVVHVLNSQIEHNDPVALVLAPTRELAQQIDAVARQFPSLRSVCLFGGSYKAYQLRALQEQRPRLVIATPGRLNDLLDSGEINLSKVDYLVLDEADRMLDMGFEPQIRAIIDHVPKERQTLMWSATWPKEVRTLAKDFLRDYIQINVGSTELQANPDIAQNILVIHEEDKRNKLVDILADRMGKHQGSHKTLIFAETKRKVDFIVQYLNRRGYQAAGIHGDKTQRYRDVTLSDFRGDRIQVLVATDVAARGLDVSDIKYVINFDFPNTVEDYVHRIGRTGRQGKKGESFTFFTREDMALAGELIEVMKQANQEVRPELEQLVELANATRAMKKKELHAKKHNAAGKYGIMKARARPQMEDRFFSRNGGHNYGSSNRRRF